MLWVKTVALRTSQVASFVVVPSASPSVCCTLVEKIVQEGDQWAILLNRGKNCASGCRCRTWLMGSKASQNRICWLISSTGKPSWTYSLVRGVALVATEHLDQFLTEGRTATVIDISASSVAETDTSSTSSSAADVLLRFLILNNFVVADSLQQTALCFYDLLMASFV